MTNKNFLQGEYQSDVDALREKYIGRAREESGVGDGYGQAQPTDVVVENKAIWLALNDLFKATHKVKK